ncbi:expressed unknown protein [Seminavis robusta]|uniref:Peptidase M12B domain-containing protein n=1 Tax=Seminavis robusta TaxID=568900 RepID=A0A9N8DP21_9STRA|nr:expressed unknown protein [Seminavis robusta]|eukprot:Sro269_g103970.1 n/a (460) ;mRNA; f:33034-34682
MRLAHYYFVSLGLFFTSWTNAQDIKPVSEVYQNAANDVNATNKVNTTASLVDLSELRTEVPFYEKDTLTMQLMDDLPVWTIHSIQKSDPVLGYWSGLSPDRMVSGRLLNYIHPSTGIVVIRGVVHDLANDISYQIKPDGQGEDTVTKIRSGDLPPVGDSRVPIWSQIVTFARNPWGVATGVAKSVGWKLQSLTKSQEEMARNAVTVDIMVIWTPNAECAVSSQSVDCSLTDTTLANMEADIAMWVVETNTVHSNSGTGITFNVVHQQRDTSGYRETADASCILCDLTDTCHCQLGYIHGLRNDYKADLVTLIADTINLSSSAVCGIAWIGSCCQFNACYGFSVNDAACTNSGYVPAHEFGHNMGCRHDRGTSSTQQCPSDACTSCDTNFGYRVPGQFRTIMAYNCDTYTTQCDGTATASCPVIPYFSGEAEYNGNSLGGAENNCRGAIISSKGAIAGFR